jgi:glycosyltransferase involved in cell wall biosynthesis
MRIGINARFLVHPYTGIGQYTRNLLSALAKADLVNEYYLFTPEMADLDLPSNFHQIRVPERNYRSASIRKAHWEHILVPKEMEQWNLDRAHFLYPCNPRKKLPFPTIVTVHDVIPWRLPEYRKRFRSKVYNFYAKLALKKADHVITVSEFSKSEILKLFRIPENNISVIPLAPPQENQNQILPDLRLRHDFLLYVGGYDSRKNVHTLLRAYQKFIANDYAIDFILVGAKDKGLERFLTNEFCPFVDGRFPVKPKGKVIFTPPLSGAELAGLYSQAYAFAHASIYEGFNLPLVEAMSHGLPIVCSDIPVNREVTEGHAIFIDPSSVDAVGNGIHELVNDKAKQKSLAAAGLKRSRDFSWEKHANEVLYVYNLFT